MSHLLAALAPRFPPAERQTLAFCACVAAVREGRPLPDVDAEMVGYRDVVDAVDFVREFAPTMKATGAERVGRIFAHVPALAIAVAAL